MDSQINLKRTTDFWPLDQGVERELRPTHQLVFSTSNPDKLREIAAALGLPEEEVRGQKLRELLEPQPDDSVRSLIESGRYEQASAAICGQKAVQAWKISGTGVCVEDTGLYTEALRGYPGPEIKSWNHPDNLATLCDLASNSGRRGATMIVAFGFYPGFGEPQVRSAVLRGEIAAQPRGTNGFGFDCIFVPDPTLQAKLFPGKPARTIAEMEPGEKAQLNPRTKALTSIAQQPFEFASNPPRILLPTAAAKVAIRDLKTKVPSEHREKVLAASITSVEQRRQRIFADMRSETGRKTLVRTGEVSERVMDDDITDVRERILPFDMGRLRIISRDSGARAIAHSVHRLELLNHPFALEAMLRQERLGYVAVGGKSVPPLDAMKERRQAATYDDFKLGFEGATEGSKNQERVIAILAGGMGSWTSTRCITYPILGASVPSMISAWSLAEGALCGIPGFTPCDSYWSDHTAQIEMSRAALAYIDSHPFISTGRWNDVVLSNGETVKDFVLRRAHKMIGATLKARPETIADIADQFRAIGVSTFRVYEAGATRPLQAAVRVLAEHYRGDSNYIMWAGQVGGVAQARECVDAGAHGLIVGVGDGALCSTADVAALAGNNPLKIYEIVAARLGIPVIADGGVGSRAPVAHALGAAGRMMAGSLSGGTVSLRLVKFANGDGEVYDPEYGEASAPTKHRGGQVDALGEAMGVEGIAARRPVDFLRPTLADRVFASLLGVAKSLRFDGLSSLAELVHQAQPNLWVPTGAALRAGSPHHDHPETKDVPRPFQLNFEPLSL
ncbi:MAG: IMP dehydrogenase [Oligoflexia bacterium]|nr:IMP dehydrogenase [Oligoflexia bacterium]